MPSTIQMREDVAKLYSQINFVKVICRVHLGDQCRQVFLRVFKFIHEPSPLAWRALFVYHCRSVGLSSHFVGMPSVRFWPKPVVEFSIAPEKGGKIADCHGGQESTQGRKKSISYGLHGCSNGCRMESPSVVPRTQNICAPSPIHRVCQLQGHRFLRLPALLLPISSLALIANLVVHLRCLRTF